jgi:predicted transposase YbfD/YdcC
MHCIAQKTVETIISTGNHYIIQVKANQKTLLNQMKINTSDPALCVNSIEKENRARGRLEIRKTFICKNLTGISPDWIGLKRLIRVERTVTTKKETTHETACYISSFRSNKASFFGFHIRGHWGIENKLHWCKDVSMNEDNSKTSGGMAAENISVLRNIVINLFRTNGYDSIKCAMEVCVNNLKEIIRLTKYKTVNYKIT